MEWMLLPYRRYAEFEGRSRRMEYWMYALFQGIVITVLVMLALAVVGTSGVFAMQGASEDEVLRTLVSIPALWLVGIAAMVFWLGSAIPGIALVVRRLHDRDVSGWWYLGYILVSWIPIVSFAAGIVFLVFMVLEGTRGPNRFGPDPKDPGSADVFA